MKTYMVIADISCAGTTHIYVNCREDQIDAFMKQSGFGCSECRHYQEVDLMDMDKVDYVVTEQGNVFAKMYPLNERN